MKLNSAAGAARATTVRSADRPREQLEADWRYARDEAAMAYAHWCRSRSADRRMAYAVYLAAADREAAAEVAFLATAPAR